MARSWWGWGNVEQRVDDAEAVQLVERAAALLPGHDFTVHAPPDPERLDVPMPRVAPPAALTSLASAESTDRLAHARGKAYRDVVRNLEGRVEHAPDVVMRPCSEEDVVDVLDWCTRESVAVVPFGGGSSVVGGVEPRFDRPAVSLDLTGMDQVVEVDPRSRAARIQAGVLGPHLEAQLRPHGLTLRHFPQSFEFSTLGGWLATRAGGHFATLYTHIDALTESMRVVTPNGISASRRLPGSGAGPSPDRMFLGSEGALGVITEAWMRLQSRPRWQQTATVTFGAYDRAVDATRAVGQSGLYPSDCRLLDPMEAFLNAGVATDGGVLVLAFESADHPVDHWLDRGIAIVTEQGGEVASRSSRDERDRQDTATSWKSSFLRMPYQRDAMAQRSMVVETFETACTWDAFASFHAGVTAAAQEAIERICGIGVVTCRFSHVYPDGPAPYYGIYAPGRWGGLVEQWDELKAVVSQAIIDHGGTITHHHAIGRDQRPWYDLQRPEPFAAALVAAKHSLDPAGVLNPGVLVG